MADRTFRTSWGHDIAVRDVGEGPVVVFSHGLLWSKQMYAPQIAELSKRFRCVAWDHPCQGESSDHPGGIVPMDVCADVGAELIESLDAGPVHFVGLSMGGFVGMRLAARRPELIRSLANLCTAADPEPIANHGKYRRLNLVARLFGVRRFLAGQVLPIMFGPTFLGDPARADEKEIWTLELMKNRRRIYRSVNGVIERQGIMDEVGKIEVPTLQLHGSEDAAIARERAQRTADAIPGARFQLVPGAGHTMTVEAAGEVTRILSEWLAEVGE